MNNSKRLIPFLLVPLCGVAFLTGCQDTKNAAKPTQSTNSPQVTSTPITPPVASPSPTTKLPETKNTPSLKDTTSTSTTGKTLSGKRVADGLKKPLEQQLGFNVNSLACPEKVNFAKGSVFTCQVTVDNDTFPLEVNLTDEKGNFTFQSKGMLVRSKVESQMQEAIKKETATETKVTCGDKKVLLVKTLDTFKCEATTKDGKKKTIDLKAQPENGAFEWKIPK